MVTMSLFEVEAKISVRVYPNAATNEVVGSIDEVLQVRVSAPPIKGKANKELIGFLSRVLDVGESRISIIKGHTSRNKVIAVDGLSRDELLKRLPS